MSVIKPFTTTYSIRGHKYEVTSNAEFDDNGKVKANKKLDDIAKYQALDMFRKDQGYVFPEEIKSYRNKIGFSQKDLAELLGMSPNTIALYELGSLPSEANNNLLKLLFTDDDNLKKTAQGENVPQRVKNKVNAYLSGNPKSSLPSDTSITSDFSAIQLANWLLVEHNMKLENDENYEYMTQMKLIKLLYFAYGIFLAKTKNKLFSSEIRHYDYGPLVMDVHKKYNHQREINDELDKQAYKDYIDISANNYISEILAHVYDKYGKYTASYLSKITHQKNSPWSETADRAIISDDLIYQSFANNHEM